MGIRWEDLQDLFVARATTDLEEQGEVQAALGAFAGAHLQFLAWLRPFSKGAYADPLIELCALAMPLEADRLALCMSGRVWSLNDPIPPVTEDADLRQQALVLSFVDGAQGRPRSWSAIHPFDLADGVVRWHTPKRLAAGEGWIPRALEVAVRDRRRLRTDVEEIRRQAIRVAELGHDLYMPPEVAARLGLASS